MPASSTAAPLAFHKVQPDFSYSATNYSPRRLRSLLQFMQDNHLAPSLTFDDAYESFLDFAAPILTDFQLGATVFAPVGWLGKVNSWDYSCRLNPVRHLSGSQLRVLSDQGFSIQSHGYRHVDLTQLSESELNLELRKSKEELEDILSLHVNEICYPFGRYNKRVEERAREIGYERGWSLNAHDDGGFTKGRWGIYGFDTAFSVRAKLNGGVLGSIEYAKARLTNQLSRAGRFAFWTSNSPS